MKKAILLWPALFLLFAPALQAQDAPPALTAAVKAYVEKKGYHEVPQFRYALTDLSGDGLADAVVLLVDRTWCGSGGCHMLVFKGVKEGFTCVSGSTITREPIRVSTDREAGWKTLIVYTKGTGDVLMRFNGTRYPLNPSMQPKASPAQVRDAQTLIE